MVLPCLSNPRLPGHSANICGSEFLLPTTSKSQTLSVKAAVSAGALHCKFSSSFHGSAAPEELTSTSSSANRGWRNVALFNVSSVAHVGGSSAVKVAGIHENVEKETQREPPPNVYAPDCPTVAVEGQVTELREESEGLLTRRYLFAAPLAMATLLVSPTLAMAVIVENRAPSGNFLLRSLGIGDPDIFYPRFFQGTWNCYSTLMAVETPQGDDKADIKSVEQARGRIGNRTTYQARFVPFEGYVVCDRLFTTVSLVESLIGKNTVEHGSWDPRQPNRLELVLRGGAKVENTVTKRSAGMFSSYEFESAEFSRQVLDNFSVKDGPPTVKASQNLTRYQWDMNADQVSKIEAIQKVSMYAVPKEGRDFEGLEMFNATSPVTIYKYRLTFERI